SEGNRLLLPKIGEHDLQIPGEESHLPKSLPQQLKIKHRLLKDIRVRKKTYFRSSPLGISDDGQRTHDLSSLIALMINLSVVADIHFQPHGQRIDDGGSHTVQTAGYLVSSSAELAAGMKDGKHHLHGRNPFFLVDSHRNSPPVIPDSDGVIFVDIYLNGIAVARQGLINGIIYNLIYQMVKALGGSASDVHTRPFAHCFQTF